MRRSKPFWKEIGALIFLALLVGFTYRRLPLTFFQQDEWHSLGIYTAARLENNFSAWLSYLAKGSFLGLLGHFNPLVVFFNVGQFTLFGLNFSPYAYLSMFFHFINSLLVYFFVTRLTKKRMVGLLTGVLFATWYNSHQAVTWIGTYAGIQGATVFLLLSLIFFLKYQDGKKAKKYYYLSLGMLLMSLGFREATAFLFIFFPIWSLLKMTSSPRVEARGILSYVVALPRLWRGGASSPSTETRGIRLATDVIKRKKNWQFSWLKEQKPLIICLFIYIGLRALTLLTKVKKSSVVLDASWGYLPITIYNLIVMPLTTISQIFVPENMIGFLVRQIPDSFFKSKFLTGIHSIPVIPTVFVSLLLSFLIIALVVKLTFFLCRQERRDEANIILLALIWIATAALPFAFLGRPLAFLEGRYYYVSAIGAALLLSMIIFYIADGTRQKLVGSKARDGFYCGLVAFMIIPILFFHSTKIRRDIERSVKIGDEQKAILSEIKKTYPVIGKKSIFYVEPLMYPTFYSGFGHTLMVVYAHERKLDPKFFKEDFLWSIWDQGYREAEGNGFGYFWQYSKLAETIKEFHLSPENVYAFHYDTQTKKLENITDDFRNSLKYSDMAAYISRPQRGKRLLGAPDGQRRSFNSGEFVPTEIKEVINLTDNEEWVASDFIAQQTRRTIPGTKDYLITYNYGLEATYGGAYLIYHLVGNNTDIYRIPERLYGFKVAGFSSINPSARENSIMEKVVQKEDGSFEVTLLSAYPSSATIEFTLLLNSKVLYYKPREGVNDIVVGQFAKVTGDGESKKFTIPLPGTLKSLRSFWENDDVRYQPKAFVNGVMTPITSWGTIETSSLTIEFEEPPASGAVIKVPILITYAPKPDDIIKIVNF